MNQLSKMDIVLDKDINSRHRQMKGGFVTLGNEKMYRIENFDQMPLFFMTLVSSSECWMYLSSTGCLTAGRKNPDNAIFPYYTVDKLHDNAANTGPITLIKIGNDIWQPFTTDRLAQYKTSKNIYKNEFGTKVVFEEINYDLEMIFRYSWKISEKYGFVREASLKNASGKSRDISLLDGLQNILPHGIHRLQQKTLSNLMDAYKRTELLSKSDLALYYLNAIPVDRAEPSESLVSNICWNLGLENCNIHISSDAINEFIKGGESVEKYEKRAGRGAFLLDGSIQLDAGQMESWSIIVDQGYNAGHVTRLVKELEDKETLSQVLSDDLQHGEEHLKLLVFSADGLQRTGNQHSSVRHYYNTLFNIMRGGVFYDNYTISKDGITQHVKTFNISIFERFKDDLGKLPEEMTLDQLVEFGERSGEPQLVRIIKEYLPLIFSRRHGDPSRPWNIFNINLKDEEGNTRFYYQGNWRDIFQNWEALLYSFPGYTDQIITKFVNASTADGYNPYRISSDGVDWEIIEPDDPWSYIGYWGDHQVIYLQRLLELAEQFYPASVKSKLKDNNYAFAQVPYIIKSFGEILKNPYSTVDFDEDLDRQLRERSEKLGADGRLYSYDEKPILVNLTEKLLVSTLTKLYNLVPDAGIWLNTQRPEWNDANNALVGYGCSMVTVYYLNRQLKFYQQLFEGLGNIEVSADLVKLFHSMLSILSEFEQHSKDGFDGKARMQFVTKMGMAGGKYRNAVYHGLSSQKKTLSEAEICELLQKSLQYLKASIANNKRADGLYHAYNLMDIGEDSIEVRYLYEMLEGQVAILSADYLGSEESLEVLDALRSSSTYNERQQSYMLYPNRDLPGFLEKSLPSRTKIESSSFLMALVNDGHKKIIYKDVKGSYRFADHLKNREYLIQELELLKPKEADKSLVLDLYEDTFEHKLFTGRSGTFFGYEGLGSIYWHMVSKLQLAIGEQINRFSADETEVEVMDGLLRHYNDVKEGIGAGKSPELYGAFPFEPYSHTPNGEGVKQPGMTGQVKEDYLSRIHELGLHVENGKLTFDFTMLADGELLPYPTSFYWYDVNRKLKTHELVSGTFAFTFCQVPIIVHRAKEQGIQVVFADGTSEIFEENQISIDVSQKIFSRTGEIEKIIVNMLE